MVSLSAVVSGLKKEEVISGFNSLLDRPRKFLLDRNIPPRLQIYGFKGDIRVQEIAQKFLSANPADDWESSTLSELRLQRMLDFDTLWERIKEICDISAILDPSKGIQELPYDDVQTKAVTGFFRVLDSDTPLLGKQKIFQYRDPLDQSNGMKKLDCDQVEHRTPIDIIRLNGRTNITERNIVFTLPVAGLLVHAPVRGQKVFSRNLTIDVCVKEWEEKYGYKITGCVTKRVLTEAEGLKDNEGVSLTRESIQKIFDEVMEKNRKETRFVSASQAEGTEFLRLKFTRVFSSVGPNCSDERKQCAITVVGGVSIALVVFLALKAVRP